MLARWPLTRLMVCNYDPVMLERQRNSNSDSNSSKEDARLSVPHWRAATFLEGLANLDTSNSQKVEAFVKRFEDLLPTLTPGVGEVRDLLFRPATRDRQGFIATSELDRKKPASDRSSSLTQFENELKSMLERLWKEPTPFIIEARLMRVAGHEANYEAEKGRLVKDNFLMVLLFAIKHAHLLHYCQNPECKKPYFVAQRASQVYCSVQCAEPAQREAKIRWWREHGDERRKKSRKKAKK